MQGFMRTIKRIATPLPPKSELEKVRDLLRLGRDYHLPEESMEALLDTAIHMLIDYEIKHGGPGAVSLKERSQLAEEKIDGGVKALKNYINFNDTGVTINEDELS